MSLEIYSVGSIVLFRLLKYWSCDWNKLLNKEMTETHKQRQTYNYNDIQTHSQKNRNRHTKRHTKIDRDTETQLEKQTEIS